MLSPFGRWGQVLFDRKGAYQMVVSPQIVAEYLDVLRRPRLERRFRAVASRDFRAILDLIDGAVYVEPAVTRSICRDPEDDKFLAAALAGRAHYVVSEDADLLDLRRYEDTAIVDAATFLPLLAERNGGSAGAMAGPPNSI